MSKLTPKERKFAELCVTLGNQSEAYRQAYDVTDKDATWVKVRASELANKSNIKVTIEEIKGDTARIIQLHVRTLLKCCSRLYQM